MFKTPPLLFNVGDIVEESDKDRVDVTYWVITRETPIDYIDPVSGDKIPVKAYGCFDLSDQENTLDLTIFRQTDNWYYRKTT